MKTSSILFSVCAVLLLVIQIINAAPKTVDRIGGEELLLRQQEDQNKDKRQVSIADLQTDDRIGEGELLFHQQEDLTKDGYNVSCASPEVLDSIGGGYLL